MCMVNHVLYVWKNVSGNANTIYKCSKKCNEICDRPRCNKPCTKLLKCLHPCIGLCREKCPQLCRECDAAQIRECFLGRKSKPDARFIQLEDCEHIFEVSDLDHYMDQQDSTDHKPVKIQFLIHG